MIQRCANVKTTLGPCQHCQPSYNHFYSVRLPTLLLRSIHICICKISEIIADLIMCHFFNSLNISDSHRELLEQIDDEPEDERSAIDVTFSK